MLAMQWQLERSQWWQPELILEQQFRQVRALAAHALANVPFYGDALRPTGLPDAGRLTPDAFRRWPVLRKADVRASEAKLQAAHYPKEHGAVGETYTTGSTGTPLRIIQTQAAEFFSHAMVIRDHLLHERDFNLKYAAIRSQPGASPVSGWGLPNAMFRTGPGRALDLVNDVDTQLDWLLAERPGYLLSYPTNLRALVLRSRELGRLPEGLVHLIAFGEMLPPDLRALAREHWNVPVVDAYSCQEVGAIASQCPGHEHYLVHAENLYVEILREDGAPCAPGEIGEVVITALHNFAMPLIRYAIGDYAEAGARCPTGRGLPVLHRVVGRVRNMLRDPTGRTRWPSFPGKFWYAIAPFRQIRLVQHTLSEIEVQYACERALTEGEHERIVSMLNERLGYPFGIRFTRLEQIARARNEKWEDFVSLLPPSQA